MRRSILGLAIAVATAGVLIALRPRRVPIEIATAARGPLVVAVEETGRVRIKDRYIVSAPVSGSLARVRFEPGDVVHEGDALAGIAPTSSPLLDQRTREQAEARVGAATSALDQARAQEGRARAAKELAETELTRVRTLVTANALGSSQLDDASFSEKMRSEELRSATFAVKTAGEELRLARATLGDHAQRGDRHIDVLSPVSGAILAVNQKSETVVQAGTKLVEVGDPTDLEIVVDLLTTDAVRVNIGSAVVIRGWGGDVPLAGRVHRIEPSAFTRVSALGVDEQRVNVVIALTDPREKWAALGDGYRVEARLVLWQAESVVTVPLGAVFRRGDGWAAFRVDGGIAKLVRVEVGHRGDTDVEILSGLEPGAPVAVHPSDRVKDGARVEAR